MYITSTHLYAILVQRSQLGNLILKLDKLRPFVRGYRVIFMNVLTTKNKNQKLNSIINSA